MLFFLVSLCVGRLFGAGPIDVKDDHTNTRGKRSWCHPEHAPWVSATRNSRTTRVSLRVALLTVAPVLGRYRKGRTSLIGNLWWEVHKDCMIICAEALLPLAITAIFATGGPHTSSHATWGEDTHERMKSQG